MRAAVFAENNVRLESSASVACAASKGHYGLGVDDWSAFFDAHDFRCSVFAQFPQENNA